MWRVYYFLEYAIIDLCAAYGQKRSLFGDFFAVLGSVVLIMFAAKPLVSNWIWTIISR